MLFSKKNKDKKVKCESCSSKISDESNFCPNCGESRIDEETEREDLGLLGRTDINDSQFSNDHSLNESLGVADKLIGSLVNSLVKNLGKQFKDLDKIGEKTNIQAFPNGIKIRIGPPIKRVQKASMPKNIITEEQIKKISSLPKATAKTSIKRLSDKVIYELATPKIASPKDVFVSKLESGYEIKAISDKKVYVNTIPIDLPLRGFSLNSKKLSIEFHAKGN
jgi:hypothetical protein